MPKKKWLSRHSDGRHFPVDYLDKSDLPKGNMDVLAPNDEKDKEITAEEYLDGMYIEPEEETALDKIKRGLIKASNRFNKETDDMRKDYERMKEE
jgi:hypothetical protein